MIFLGPHPSCGFCDVLCFARLNLYFPILQPWVSVFMVRLSLLIHTLVPPSAWTQERMTVDPSNFCHCLWFPPKEIPCATLHPTGDTQRLGTQGSQRHSEAVSPGGTLWVPPRANAFLSFFLECLPSSVLSEIGTSVLVFAEQRLWRGRSAQLCCYLHSTIKYIPRRRDSYD